MPLHLNQSDLIARITTLENEINSASIDDNAPFKERLLVTYQKTILPTLKSALEEDDAPTLVKILQVNWEAIKHTLLSYTAQPQLPLTLLLCDIAKMLSDVTEKPAITLLMPGIYTDSIAEYAPDLTDSENVPLDVIVKTHIVSENGTYLVPVRALCELTLPEDPTQKWFNPYFDYKDESGNIEISENDRLALIAHSKDTETLQTLKEEYSRLINKDSLLDQLNTLMKSLQFNSKVGAGSETHAGEGVYAAILCFGDFYNLLSEEQKNQIPTGVKSEIGLLLDLSSDPTKNINATLNIDTCIFNRRQALKAQIDLHQEALNAIGIEEEKCTQLLTEIKVRHDEQRNMLKEMLRERRYNDGSDKKGVTNALLASFGVNITISSFSDLNDFIRCTPEEIHQLLLNDALQNQIIAQFSSAEDFSLFLLDIHPTKLKILLSHIGSQLGNKLIRDYWDIIACITFVQGESLRDVCLAITNSVNKTVKSIQELMPILASCNPEQQKVLMNIYESKILNVTSHFYEFGQVYEVLSPDCRTILFNMNLRRLPKLILDSHAFNSMYEYLDIEHRALLFNVVGTKIPEIIITIDDFMGTHNILSDEHRPLFIQTILEKLPHLVKDLYDVANCIRLLSGESLQFFCNKIKEKVQLMTKPELVNTSVFSEHTTEQFQTLINILDTKVSGIVTTYEKFNRVYRFLPPIQKTIFFNAIATYFSKIIQSSYHFNEMYYYLNDEHKLLLVEEMKERLLGIITTSKDFIEIYKNLKGNHRSVFVKSALAILPEIIKSTSDLRVVVDQYGFTPEEDNPYSLICAEISAKFHELIENSYDFFRVMRHISLEDHISFYSKIEPRLIQMINDCRSFGEVFSLLTPAEHELLYPEIEERLPDLIESSTNFREVFMNLTPIEHTSLYARIKSRIPNLIKTATDLDSIFECLTPDERSSLYPDIKSKLPSLINHKYDLCVFKYLTTEQSSSLYKNIKSKLLEWINQPHGLIYIFSCLPNKKKKSFYTKIAPQLPEMINTASDFNCIFSYLSAEVHSSIYAKIASRLPKMIKTSSDLNYVFKHLAPEEHASLYTEIESKLPELIYNATSFDVLFRHLTPEEHASLYTEVESRLPEMIETAEDLFHIFKHLTPEEHESLYPKIAPRLLDLINNVNNFKHIYSCLTSDEKISLLTQIEPMLPSIIKNHNDLGQMLDLLPFEFLERLCKRFASFLVIPVNALAVLAKIKGENNSFVDEWIRVEHQHSVFSSCSLPDPSSDSTFSGPSSLFFSNTQNASGDEARKRDRITTTAESSSKRQCDRNSKVNQPIAMRTRSKAIGDNEKRQRNVSSNSDDSQSITKRTCSKR